MNDEAERYRVEGNKHFGAKHFNNAIQCYTRSLECCISASVLSNRSQAYLNLDQYEKALMDSTKALELDPESVKSLYRRAVAYINLGLFSRARKDLEAALTIKPKNEQIEILMESIAGKEDVKEKRVFPVDKCTTIRSEEHLMDLEIEVDDSPLESPESEKETEPVAPINTDIPIPPVPQTSYQFLTDFASLSSVPEKFARYFLAISPVNYQSLFNDVVDTDMITTLIDGCARLKISDLDVTLSHVADAFIALPTVRGFNIAAMFLSEENKGALRDFLKTCNFDSNTVYTIGKLYDL